MAGPGAARSVGKVGVDVVPDLTTFRDELKAQLEKKTKGVKVEIPVVLDTKKAKAEFDAMVKKMEAEKIGLEVDVDKKSLAALKTKLASTTAKTKLDLGDSENKGNRFLNLLKKINNTGAEVGGTFLKVFSGLLFNKITIISLGVIQLIGVLSQLSVVLFQSLGVLLEAPAAFFALAAAIGTVILGFDGIKKAFAGFGKTLKPIQDQVSQVFEESFEPVVENLEELLPKLTPGLKSIAGGLGAIAQQGAAVANTPKNVALLQRVLDRIGNFFRKIAPAFGDFEQALLDIIDVGTEGMGSFADTINKAAKRFKDFIAQAKETGRLKGWITGGVNAVKQLWQWFVDLGHIIGDVFNVFDSAGLTFSGNLFQMTHDLRTFLESASGQDVLKKIGEGLGKIRDAFIKVLKPVIDQLGPKIGDIVNDIGDVADAFATIASPVITAFAKAVRGVIDFFEEHKDWAVPVAAAILTITVALKGLSVAMAANPLGLLLTSLALIIGFMEENKEAVGNFGLSLANIFTHPIDFGKLLITGDTDQWLDRGITKSKQFGALMTDAQKKTLAFTQNAINNFFGFDTQVSGSMNHVIQVVTGMFTGMSSVAAQELAKVRVATLKLFGIDVPSSLGKVGSAATSNFGKMSKSAQTGAAKSTAAVHGMGDDTKAFLDGLGASTFSSGAAVTNNFADGILSAVWRATGAAAQVVSAVSSFFPHSPAKVGPFSGTGWTPYRGMALTEGFAEGMIKSIPAVTKAAQQVAMAASDPFADGSAAIKATFSSMGDFRGADVTSTQNVKTSLSSEGSGIAGQISQGISNGLSSIGVEVSVGEKTIGRVAQKYSTANKRRGTNGRIT